MDSRQKVEEEAGRGVGPCWEVELEGEGAGWMVGMELEEWERWGVGAGNEGQGVGECRWGQEVARWYDRRC